MENLPTLIAELQHRPKCHDWGARVLFLSQNLWATMKDPDLFDRSAGHGLLDKFVELLRDDEVFVLAPQVIPELRPGSSAETLTRHHRYVVHQLQPLLHRDAASLQRSQDSFDSPSYRREKGILRDIELHRTKLYLQRTKTFTAQEEKEILEWLDACPTPLRDNGGSKGDEDEDEGAAAGDSGVGALEAGGSG